MDTSRLPFESLAVTRLNIKSPSFKKSIINIRRGFRKAGMA